MSGALIATIHGVAGSGGSAAAFSASGSPSSVYGYGSTTSNVVVTVSGGTSPYTYQWVLGLGSGISPTNPNGATTAFADTTGQISPNICNFYCTVTDANGIVAFSNIIYAYVYEAAP